MMQAKAEKAVQAMELLKRQFQETGRWEAGGACGVGTRSASPASVVFICPASCALMILNVAFQTVTGPTGLLFVD